MVKIRLSRGGAKKQPFYHIVVADSRAPRDGKFIEKLGVYNPNTNPATIELNFDRALYWVHEGAQPTDTARAILAYRGVMYKKHLDVGVRKGALTEDQATKKFEEWMKSKEDKIQQKSEQLAADAVKAKADKLAAETEAKEKKAAAITAKNSELAAAAEAETAAEEAPAAEGEVAPAEEPAAEEAPAEEPAAEEAPAEEPAAEAEEAPAEDKAE